MTRLTQREIWKSVVGFEGAYECSNMGRVRSVARDVQRGGRTVRLDGYELQPGSARDGYKRVVLCRDSVMKTCKVHQIVAEAFNGPRPEGLITRHKNDDKHDNRADNLEYGTHIQNAADLKRNGKQLQGEQCPGARLTEQDVREIRESAEPRNVLALRFGVSAGYISNICARRKWAHVA